MFNRRAVTRAGRAINSVAEWLRKNGYKNAQEVDDNVRLMNAVAYQYFLIPRSIREEYFREELVADGVQLCDVAEE